MSNSTLCDLCGVPVMPKFENLGYKVTVKKLQHSYDGYNPWIRKTKLDICEQCMKRLVLSAHTTTGDTTGNKDD